MKNFNTLKRHWCAFGFAAVLSVSFLNQGFAQDVQPLGRSINEEEIASYFVQIKARNKYERTKIQSLGVSIENIVSDSIYGTATPNVLARLKQTPGILILESFELKKGPTAEDFPQGDSRFHNYERMTKALHQLAAANPHIMRVFSLGSALERLPNGSQRQIWCVQVNSSPAARRTHPTTFSAKPGIVFLGNHHAREHVSAEIPLMLLEFLAQGYRTDSNIRTLIEKRDIYFIPMVNPDGVEHDIATGKYISHRKNVRNKEQRSRGGAPWVGVDLNRNYGYMWKKGAPGASDDPSSDVYRGPDKFSEPETQAIERFIHSHPNLKVLLSFHTFSELILYPWGYTYDSIDKIDPRREVDQRAYVNMAKAMAAWNRYTPQRSSDLYITTGDTTDWSYGQYGIFSFTFELSPKNIFGGGFYPGAKVLDKVFQDNIKPTLYLIELADDPRRAASPMRDERLSWLYGPRGDW